PMAVFSNCCELTDSDPAAPAAPKRSELLEGFHRLTQELGTYGIAAVASPYCLDPVSAAGWMEAFYAELAVGRSVSGAAREARRKALRDSRRAVAFEPVERSDWCEPVVYESAELSPLLPMPASREGKA